MLRPKQGPVAIIGEEHAHPTADWVPPRLLALDGCGHVLSWLTWQDAVCLYARQAVSWTLGDPCLAVRGGHCRQTGRQTIMILHPIIAARGQAPPQAVEHSPPLSNAALFARDSYLCLYCGQQPPRAQLTRDHVIPASRGGSDTWENVVTACFRCNSRKANLTPQQAGMRLLAVPYRPSWIEHMILSNRNLLADQMEFLTAQLPKRSKLVS